ncbi:hypothetical protein C5O80_31480 [Burkholderia sp. SRS-46]|nr:hypothetical protein C5O80_31480 [Burkholderia sp. SRS-46]
MTDSLKGLMPRLNRVQSMDRAFGLLRFIAGSNVPGMTLTDLMKASGLPKATVARLVAELLAVGFVLRDAERRYHLGPFARELGIAAAAHFRLPDLCRPVTTQLADATGDMVYLKMRSGTDAICIEIATANKEREIAPSCKGGRVSLGVGAGGLALLSFMSEPERHSVLGGAGVALPASGGVMGSDVLAGRIERTRDAGFAENADDVVPGMSAIGVPVFDATGWPVLALSVATSTSRLTAARRQTLLSVLREHAERMQKLIRSHRVAAHDPLTH